MLKILVAEDDNNTRKLMNAILRANGYFPIPACDGQDALHILEKQHIDLMIVDVSMPRIDGFELTKHLRDCGYALPILMVTARQAVDKRYGFLVGTDDYMTKPVDEEETLLRIKALMRRAKIVIEHKITLGEVVLDYDNLLVRRGMESHTLPRKDPELNPEEREEYLDIILDEADRLAKLSTNVLNLSKIENQALLSGQSDIDLGEHVRRAMLMIESKWVKKQLELEVQITMFFIVEMGNY